jgi:N-acetylglucosaminyl-diphospho-decaprenol L-rhamnosyltransferase
VNYDNLFDIIIINWNSGNLLKRCVVSIQSSIIPLPGKLIVVDNGSSDNSADTIPDMRKVQLIKSAKNLGFGGGCKLGAAQGKAPFILFLNPDIRFYPDTLEKLTSFITSDRLAGDIAIIGAQLLNPDGSIQKNVACFPEFGDFFPRMLGLDRAFPGSFPPHFVKDMDYDHTQVVDQVPGAFFLVKRTVFKNLGEFDERFFMYYEDVDFSYRAHLAGWNTLYLAEISVQHEGGGTTEQIKGRRLFYSLRSRVLYTGKHFGRVRAVALIFGILILEFPARLFRALLHFSLDELSAVIETLGLFLVKLPDIFRKL